MTTQGFADSDIAIPGILAYITEVDTKIIG
jgi:hypothetical protein